VVKRSFDILVATISLVLLSPLELALAVGVKLTSRGPVTISTWRVGRGGRQFRHYRFRTMAPEASATNSTQGLQLRKTAFGRAIGNLSLDDLPTLFNILKGDMSIVGPRPEAPENVDLQDENWRKVLSVRPGLTGLGILTYLSAYNSTPVSERIKPEVYYVEHQSLLLDLRILGRTIYRLARMGHLKGRF
jgi:lipopolysaccharide/colanic/teichoic acid biosynthesis glycosyltransferase